MAFVCVSKGKGFSSWLIRFFTTQISRKDAMVLDGVSLVRAWWYLWLSLFGKTKYATICATFNHAFLVYKSMDFRQVFAIDIREHGPIPKAVDEAFSKVSYIRLVEPTFDIFTGIRTCIHKFDTGYDWLAVVGALIVINWYILTGIRAKKMLHSPGRNVCSEYVVSVINHSDGAMPLGDPVMVYPQLLADIMDRSNQYNLVYEGKSRELHTALL